MINQKFKNIYKYKETLEKAIREIELKKEELDDFYPIYRPEEDEGSFFVVTSLPIPSAVVNAIIKENGKIYYEYKISVKGRLSEDIKNFKDFIMKGKLLDFSFYGDVFNLTIYEEPKRSFDTFHIQFNSISSLYKILAQQREHDYLYRDYWFNNNIDSIINSIKDYDTTVETYYNLRDSVKENKKGSEPEDILFYREIEKECTILEAEIELIKLQENVKELSKKVLNPKFSRMEEINKALNAKAKIKIVGMFEEDNEIYFYNYK